MKPFFPKIIGILNCTPDSFQSVGRHLDHQAAVAHALRLFEEGADIVDIGGESTRPGAEPLSEAEERARVLPVIEGIRAATNRPLSIDTYKPGVAKEALCSGVNMLNDVSGFADPAMRALAAQSGAQIIVMHSKQVADYPNGVVPEICAFFERQIRQLLHDRVQRTQIILDPGIGGGRFGKLPEHDLEILKSLRQFQKLGFPLLVGLSRKSFMQKILQEGAGSLLPATIALNTLCCQNGAAYLRVHDVLEHRQMITLLQQIEVGSTASTSSS